MARKKEEGKGEEKRGAGKEIGLFSFLAGRWITWLLVFVPISFAIRFLGFSEIWIFASSAVAIIPLAGLIGDATEQLAIRTGPGIGGLLNATFGNATELIIALFALSNGLLPVVKASISGSIVANLLLVLGLSMLIGGWGREKQTFNQTQAGASAAMLFLGVIALVMPAIFDLTVFGSLENRTPPIEQLSLLVAGVLILTYLASLVFTLRTHKELFTSVAGSDEEPKLTTVNSVLLLLGATVLVAVESEFLVGAIEATTAALGMSEFFVGFVVVAVVGNAAEHASAVMMAMQNRMQLAVNIATGSSAQIALFVAPVLVFASLLFGEHLALVFNPFETAAVALSVITLAIVSLDGESNWFEGLQLVAVYLVMAIVFFFVPG